ncbi:LexA family transcriptional regulator [Desulfospira joergensenii]|uniref:LexA family transcriptional regulator n=1 Tax=Desulfospira joergensenii TaxID=53329 RepID=UPI0003B47F2A|nr:S24 family peptidase [Desulfospira joergensenii]
MAENKIDTLINRIMDVTGIHSQSELAKELGINRSGITHARNKNRIPDNWIVRLYRRYRLNPQWIETGIGKVFLNTETSDDVMFKQVPKVEARLSAGTGSFECGENVSEFLSFQASWLSKKGSPASMVAMEVFGRSMEPVLREGDTVLIDQSRTRILAGAIYAVGVDDTILVKRLEKLPDRLALLSENTDFQPIYISMDEVSKVRILGKVIWSCREYR